MKEETPDGVSINLISKNAQRPPAFGHFLIIFVSFSDAFSEKLSIILNSKLSILNCS
ncbi:hypothetical protein SAMN05444401_1656 [Clostridium amylolyticum]|uniref:Uncharacterized protein n=1 Tax=Clostridium amylolyticum TaxID=1121298 RepID=A0A1M6EQ86_9CLOT|nr:hypothetical protein [Clostridium amylolyticum]SHI87634.1 hypothetical protein SAMN05444401_1656 [Clostridium amylolyticum]